MIDFKLLCVIHCLSCIQKYNNYLNEQKKHFIPLNLSTFFELIFIKEQNTSRPVAVQYLS